MKIPPLALALFDVFAAAVIVGVMIVVVLAILASSNLSGDRQSPKVLHALHHAIEPAHSNVLGRMVGTG